MELKIFGANEAEKEIALKPRYWNVISIGSHIHEGFPPIREARDLIRLTFDDFDDKFLERPDAQKLIKERDLILPSSPEIAKGLEFGKKYMNGPLLVHCRAGISRSSAMAWLILFDKFREPKFATYFMYKIRSCAWPNQRIMRLGLKLLVQSKEERKAIWDKILTDPLWIEKHDELGVIR